MKIAILMAVSAVFWGIVLWTIPLWAVGAGIALFLFGALALSGQIHDDDTHDD